MAIGPIDYMGMMPQVNIAQSLGQGLQLGMAIKAQREKEAQVELAKQQQELYKADLQNALSNPTAQNWAAMSAKYPQQREAFKQSWDMLSKEQQDQDFLAGAQAFNAINAGNTDVAKNLLDQRIAAMENSGQNAGKLKAMRTTLDTDPSLVQGQLGLVLSSIDPPRWKTTIEASGAQALQNATLSEKQANAQKAAVAAKFAESNAAQDLAKGGWDIQKIQNDIEVSKQNARIAAINADISRETNQLKRAELQQKLDESIQKRDDSVRTKAADVSAARANIDNMLNTADRILQTNKDTVGRAAGTVSSRMPTLREGTADFEELVNTLGSQAFISQIPNMKGMGALSNAEGEKLQSALQNFSLRQSPEQLLKNVEEAQRLMLKARSNLATRYGVPDVRPDTPDVKTPGADIDALVNKYLAPAGGARGSLRQP